MRASVTDISFETAQRVLRRHLPAPSTDEIALDRALGRVAAREERARSDSPAFDRAIMDGYAANLSAGVAVPIVTGAAIAPGMETVIKKEDARRLSDGRLEIIAPVRRGQYILKRGAHFRKGAPLLAKGTTLEAAHIGLLASQGIGRVPVFGSVRVAVLATGDELAERGAHKGPRQIWNASGPMLVSLLQDMACVVDYLGIGRDDPGALSKKIRRGLKADVLITTGAVSVGERDLVPGLLRRAGVRTYFHRVRMRPGKPLYFGGRGQTLVFGLPGNPVSTLVSFLIFVKPALERLSGRNGRLAWDDGILTKAALNESGRFSFLPARLSYRKDAWRVSPLAYAGSADLRAAAAADCFFVLGEKQKRAPKNTRVKFIRLRHRS